MIVNCDACFVFLQIWSLTNKPRGKLLNDLALYGDYVNCVLYSPPNGEHILSASDNGLIKVCVYSSDVFKFCCSRLVYSLALIRSCGMKMKMAV